jgi:hypothetical protein
MWRGLKQRGADGKILDLLDEVSADCPWRMGRQAL